MDKINEDILVHKLTHSCATRRCIPCLHKIFPYGKSGLPSNQRPELCPRSKPSSSRLSSFLHQRFDQVLILGDGDFSFSLSLARSVSEGASAKKCLIFATSYESFDNIVKIYPDAEKNICFLRKLGAIVLHGVDATCLETHADISILRNSFGAVFWNFPCVSMSDGADAQYAEVEENRNLLTKFFENVKDYLQPAAYNSMSEIAQYPGEVYISHKTIPPFIWWGLTELAERSGLIHHTSLVFDKYLFPGYSNKKVCKNQSFPLHDARVRIYVLILSL